MSALGLLVIRKKTRAQRKSRIVQLGACRPYTHPNFDYVTFSSETTYVGCTRSYPAHMAHYRSQICITGGCFGHSAPRQCAPPPPAPPFYTQIDRSGSTRHQKVLDIRYRIVMLALPKCAPAAVLTQVPQARWDYAKTLRPGESLAPPNSVPSPLLFYHDKNYL